MSGNEQENGPPMKDPSGTGEEEKSRDFDGAVSEVMDHVAEHAARAEEGVAQGRPASRRGILVAALVVLVLVAAWDVYMLTRPPTGLPPEIVAEDLRWSAGLAAQEIEAFRAEQGRLPDPSEIADILDEGLTYRVEDDHYIVTASDGDLAVSYDGSVPLDRWLRGEGGGS